MQEINFYKSASTIISKTMLNFKESIKANPPRTVLEKNIVEELQNDLVQWSAKLNGVILALKTSSVEPSARPVASARPVEPSARPVASARTAASVRPVASSSKRPPVHPDAQYKTFPSGKYITKIYFTEKPGMYFEVLSEKFSEIIKNYNDVSQLLFCHTKNSIFNWTRNGNGNDKVECFVESNGGLYAIDMEDRLVPFTVKGVNQTWHHGASFIIDGKKTWKAGYYDDGEWVDSVNPPPLRVKAAIEEDYASEHSSEENE
jgi:hypothetical protein